MPKTMWNSWGTQAYGQCKHGYEVHEKHENAAAEQTEISYRDLSRIGMGQDLKPVQQADQQPQQPFTRERKPLKQYEQIPQTLLNHAGRAFAERQGYTNFAENVHDPEYHRIMERTGSMSLATSQDRARVWQMLREFFTRVRKVSPEVVQDYHSTACFQMKDRILNFTQNKPFEEQWQVHREFIKRVRGFFPKLLENCTKDIYTTERERVLTFTQEKPFREQWAIHQEFLEHIEHIVLRDPSQALPEYDQHAESLYLVERTRVTLSVQDRPESERWGCYQGFLVHIKDVAPEHLPTHFQAIVNTEIANIPEDADSTEREQRLNAIRAYAVQTSLMLGYGAGYASGYNSWYNFGYNSDSGNNNGNGSGYSSDSGDNSGNNSGYGSDSGDSGYSSGNNSEYRNPYNSSGYSSDSGDNSGNNSGYGSDSGDSGYSSGNNSEYRNPYNSSGYSSDSGDW